MIISPTSVGGDKPTLLLTHFRYSHFISQFLTDLVACTFAFTFVAVMTYVMEV